MSCPAAAESKCHETSICVLDPLLPIGADKPECKCRDGYQKLASGSNGPITSATNKNATKCEGIFFFYRNSITVNGVALFVNTKKRILKNRF